MRLKEQRDVIHDWWGNVGLVIHIQNEENDVFDFVWFGDPKNCFG